MFSQTMEYALRVVAFLAGRDQEPATTRQIAAATRVPEGYLAKVIQSLGRAGIVASQRGIGGGSVLALPPDQFTVYDVVQAIEPIPRIHTCPLGLKSHGKNLCAVHRRLDDAMAMVEEAFRKSTIADMLSEPGKVKPLCEVGAEETPVRGRMRLPVRR
jgi:Rrf2 family protein